MAIRHPRACGREAISRAPHTAAPHEIPASTPSRSLRHLLCALPLLLGVGCAAFGQATMFPPPAVVRGAAERPEDLPAPHAVPASREAHLGFVQEGTAKTLPISLDTMTELRSPTAEGIPWLLDQLAPGLAKVGS